MPGVTYEFLTETLPTSGSPRDICRGSTKRPTYAYISGGRHPLRHLGGKSRRGERVLLPVRTCDPPELPPKPHGSITTA